MPTHAIVSYVRSTSLGGGICTGTRVYTAYEGSGFLGAAVDGWVAPSDNHRTVNLITPGWLARAPSISSIQKPLHSRVENVSS